MARSAQLRLVTEPPPAHGRTQDPVRQVFERWVFMMGRSPARCKLDRERAEVIGAALALYEGDVATLLHAVDGMAAAPLADKPESMQEAMRELTWFLRSARNIERALAWADKLHEAAAAQDQAPPAAVLVAEPTAEEGAAAAAARERLRALAARGRAGLVRYD